MSTQTQPSPGAPMRVSQRARARKPVSAKPRQRKRRSRSVGNKVEKLPVGKAGVPLWLRSLTLLQKTTSLLLFLSVGTTATVYSWKEYVENQWSKEYKELNTLLQEERELTATNEVLKNQFANEAENEETGLTPLTPTKNIFIQSAPQIPIAEVTTISAKKLTPSNTPLAY